MAKSFRNLLDKMLPARREKISRLADSMMSNYCSTCKRHDFHWGGCADQNALLDYPYGKHPIPYPPRENKSGDSGGNLAL